jgi:hypothetical protein
MKCDYTRQSSGTSNRPRLDGAAGAAGDVPPEPVGDGGRRPTTWMKDGSVEWRIGVQRLSTATGRFPALRAEYARTNSREARTAHAAPCLPRPRGRGPEPARREPMDAPNPGDRADATSEV